MKNLIRVLLVLSITSLSGLATAAPVTIVDQSDTWDYNFDDYFNPDGLTFTFADFTNGHTGGNTGQAGFGNTTPPAGGTVNTVWNAWSALFAQIEVDLSGVLTGDATLNVAVDNGAAIWINGNEVFQENAGGYTSIWEYSTTVNAAFFIDGMNTISVIANDYGGLTYFDMQLLGDIDASPVPEPGTLALLGLGLAGLGMGRRKKV